MQMVLTFRQCIQCREKVMPSLSSVSNVRGPMWPLLCFCGPRKGSKTIRIEPYPPFFSCYTRSITPIVHHTNYHWHRFALYIENIRITYTTPIYNFFLRQMEFGYNEKSISKTRLKQSWAKPFTDRKSWFTSFFQEGEIMMPTSTIIVNVSLQGFYQQNSWLFIIWPK